MFILENVRGITSHDKGKALGVIVESLTVLGYTVACQVINSYDFGVPQKRERWYCVGFANGITFEFPKGSGVKTVLRDIVDVDNNDTLLRLSERELDRIAYHFSEMSKNERVRHRTDDSDVNSKRARCGIYSYLKQDGTLRFHMGDALKGGLQDMFYCSLDSVAPTITATREPKLWDLGRRLSLAECCKLQGFPNGFQFNVSDRQAKKQLGNSVTVPVVTEIVAEMLRQYKEVLLDEVKCDT